jgi:hypothetical protein
VHVEEVFDHRCRFGRIFAFGSAVESHASVGTGAAGDEVVEEGDIAGCGDVEVFEGEVVALAGSGAVVDAFGVGAGDVDAVVEEIVDLGAGGGVVPTFM